ncbi:MAG: GmrSD restriction endonuclease domain-containing protein [Chloroflexota bacterium]
MAQPSRDIEESEQELDSYRPDPIQFWESKQRELVSSVVDYNLATLADLVGRKEINLSPSYQRRFRWDRKRQSRLIESFLMNVPVPPVFLNEDAYGDFSIIDGKQRLTAIHEFLIDKLRLEGLEVFADINGRTFTELPPALQRIIRTRPTLRAVIILRQSDPDIKFEVFQRLNTGGVALNAQEIRNNVFSGPLNDLVQQLSGDQRFHRLLGITAKRESAIYAEMRDAELVLRFFTFKGTWRSFEGGMRRHMDEYMAQNRRPSSEALASLKLDFLRALESVEDAFGESAFRRWLPKQHRWRSQVLASLYDAEMIACYEMGCPTFSATRSLILDRAMDLFTDEGFQKSIAANTNTPSFFRLRVEKMLSLLRDVQQEA